MLIPPPVLALVLALLMGGTALLTGPLPLALEWRGGLAAILALAGTSLRLAAQLSLVRARTTISPLRPQASSQIVRGGVYRYSRNPMYLGRSLQLLAWAAWLASPAALLFVPIYIACVDRWQIAAEERALLDQFGETYAVYRSSVARWLGWPCRP